METISLELFVYFLLILLFLLTTIITYSIFRTNLINKKIKDLNSLVDTLNQKHDTDVHDIQKLLDCAETEKKKKSEKQLLKG